MTITSRYAIGNNHLYGEKPLFRFEETHIAGLTTQPIVLRGFFPKRGIPVIGRASNGSCLSRTWKKALILPSSRSSKQRTFA